MPLSIHRHAGTLTTAFPGNSGPTGSWVVGRTPVDATVRTNLKLTQDLALAHPTSGSLRLPLG